MHRALLTVLCLPICCLAVSSCTHNPRMVSGTESDYLLALRAEYLESNPNGEYNEFIKRGEVVKGMDILEVLAAWGHPKLRKKHADTTEQWIYREVDEETKDWIEYSFVFRQSVLSEWDLERHFAAGGSISVPGGRDSPSLSKSAYSAGEQTKTPKK